MRQTYGFDLLDEPQDLVDLLTYLLSEQGCFYNDAMSEAAFFTPKTDIAEVGRRLLAEQLAAMAEYRESLLEKADVTAVHETRKAIRRTSTAFKVFRPFFQPESLEPYRKRLKKMMKYLGRARDTAVFREKLEAYREASGERELDCLIEYWREQQKEADDALREYMGKPKRAEFWEEYEEFAQTAGKDVLKHPDPNVPAIAAHHIPNLIYQRVAGVRAYGDQLAGASAARLHLLRIQGKELRYTLQFFVPLLGLEIESVSAKLEQMQEHLGNLQDNHIGLQLLEETKGCKTAVSLYQRVIEQEIEQLKATFPTIWHEIDNKTWRQDLAAAVANL